MYVCVCVCVHVLQWHIRQVRYDNSRPSSAPATPNPKPQPYTLNPKPLIRQVSTLQQPPLLLRSRNGGVSFERVPIPIEALAWAASASGEGTASSVQLSRMHSGVSSSTNDRSLSLLRDAALRQERELALVDVAFGGDEMQLGAVLGRYGERSMLLVSTDGGITWEALCPQRWKETEARRKEEEARAAELERGRRLQEEAAQRIREDQERARQRREAMEDGGALEADESAHANEGSWRRGNVGGAEGGGDRRRRSSESTGVTSHGTGMYD